MEFKTEGNKLYSQGKPQGAVDAYSKGITLIEDGAEASEEDRKCLHLLYSNRSMAHLDLCLVDEALQDAECAIEANPEYPKAYARRAAVLLDLFQNKDALCDLNKAQDLAAAAGQPLDLTDEVARAKGEKWVPNCYLRRQMELCKKHKCDYVLQLEVPEEDHGEEGDAFSIVTPIWVGKEIKHVLNTMTRSGTIPGHKLSHCDKWSSHRMSARLSLLYAYAPKQLPRLVESNGRLARLLVNGQLKKEFGPDPTGEDYGLKVSDAGRTERLRFTAASLFYYRSSSIQQGEPPTQPISFPETAPWSTNPEVFDKLVASILEKTDPKIVESLERAVAYRNSRTAEEEPQTVCHGCKKDFVSPHECLCGKVFCTHLCHEGAWKSHKEECHKEFRKCPGVYFLTCEYWELTVIGVFPAREDQPLTRTLWEARGISEETPPDEACEQEATFVRQVYRERYLRDTDLMNANLPGGLQFDQSNYLAGVPHRFESECISWWDEHLSALRPGMDSLPTLLIKFEMLVTHYEADYRGLDPLPNGWTLQTQRFVTFINEEYRDHPMKNYAVRWISQVGGAAQTRQNKKERGGGTK